MLVVLVVLCCTSQLDMLKVPNINIIDAGCVSKVKHTRIITSKIVPALLAQDYLQTKPVISNLTRASSVMAAIAHSRESFTMVGDMSRIQISVSDDHFDECFNDFILSF